METATRVLSNNNNIAKDNSENCKKVGENEKETEMEIDCSIVNSKGGPFILKNNPDSNSQRQYYFSSFRKEMLWPSANVNLYELVLPGNISLQLEMNRLLPRIIITDNKRIKCSVVELLNTIVTLSLGKKSIELCLNKFLLSTLCDIGCETNGLIKNLLQNFIMQILHYISCKSTFDVQLKFLEILFQCLNSESNFIIKDYISICIKDFLQSMLNLLPKQDRQNSPIYHYTVHKIINLATYPSYNEPLTAAFAFNHLFELCMSSYLNMIVPNKYWLEFLHSFLMNLEKCNEEQVKTALRHIKDTIRSRTSIFNAKFSSRRKPLEFSNEKLEGAVTWLFEQCGNTSALLRCKCMELFEDLCVHVSNIKSTKDFVDKFSVKILNKIALQGLNDFEEIDMDNLRALARTLHFYTWMFNGKMTTPEVVFIADKNEKEKIIFLNIFVNFLSILVSKNIEDTVKDATDTAEEAKNMLVLINDIVVKIFDFVHSILLVSTVRNVIKNTWNDNMCLLISRFTLCPQKLGFSEQSLNMIDLQMLERFLADISDYLPSVNLAKFQKNFFADTQEELQNFSNVQQVITTNCDLLSLQYFLNGITRLKKWEFINLEKQLKFTFAYTKEKITNIFVSLKSIVVDNNLKDDIDINVIQYIKDLLNFFLLFYKPELADFMINLISNEWFSNNGSTATVFLDTFKQPILEFFLKNPVETLSMLNKHLLSSPQKLLLFLESLLAYATSNLDENSRILADNIIKDCSGYKDLILDVQYHDWLFKIIRQAVSLSSDPSVINEGSLNPLIPYILEEFDKATSTAKRVEVVDGFIRCFMDGSRASKSHIMSMFEKLREERSQAPEQLTVLIDKLVAMNSWLIWEYIIMLTCGACDYFFKNVNLAERLETYFGGMSSEDASKKLEFLFEISKNTNISPEERLDILGYYLIPCIQSCHIVAVLNKFYEDNFQGLYDLILERMDDEDVALRRHSLVNKIASHRLFEIMYSNIPFNIILGFHIDENPKNYLNIFLLRYSHETRHFTAKFDEEKELARLLHCSALNAYIAMVSLQVEKTFQNSIFQEVSLKNQLVWEKIIDCEKRHEFVPSSPEVKLINVMRKNGDRMRLSLEKDELNDHECMGMIVGIFLYMHDNKSVQGRDALPDWMLHFHEAFNSDKDNVILYLLRVIVNARRAFLPYMHLLFESVVKAACSYLRQNKINYLIRDVLLMILETECELKIESEIQAAQKLVEALIQQAQDRIVSVCEYNVEIIEKLIILWKSKLQVPANLETLMQSDQTLAVKIILVLLKQDLQRLQVAYKSEVQAIVRNKMFKWREPLSPLIVEILGYMVSCIPEQERDRTVKKSLVPMFREMRRAGSADFCAHMFYKMYLACPSLAKHEDLLTFVNPIDLKNDECKAECFEMFFETMMDLKANVMHEKLESMKFIELLNDKTMLPCVEVAFKIIDKLISIFNAKQLLPYARVVEKYAKKDALHEHKNNAIGFFIDVYKKYINVAPEESDEHTKNLLTLSEHVLINSVSDPLDEIQEEVLDFWRDSTQLTENTVDRLKRILDMFSLEVHSSYAQFLCLLMLDLTNKYSDNQKLLFGPLTPCNYENQEVVVPRKSRSKALTRSPTQQHKSKSPTKVDDSARQKIDNADVKLSKRTFSSNEEIDEYAFLYPVVTRNYAVEYDEKLKVQKLEQENFMKFNRTYKETFLPDVEINQADVVATIEDYAKRCPSYAADLSVSIVCGMLDHFKDEETYDEILESLANMCRKALKEANDFAPSVLEILYKCDCPFDVDDVLKISISMDLQSLGILILEKKITTYDYFDLYGTGKKISSRMKLNVHLASLYRSINEPDVVNSIFKNWSLDSTFDFLCEGSAAEVEMEWSVAKEAYEEGFNTSSGLLKDYCMEGMFECLSKLSSWSEINEAVEATVQGKDLNSIWQHPKKEHLLPWMFKAQLQEKLENLVCGNEYESDFSNLLEAWVNEKGDSITRPYGEELSLFFLCNGDSTTARKCLDSCLRDMRERWTLKESNQRVVDKFKRLNEIELYMNAVEKDPLDGTKELVSYWETNVPEIGDDLLNWSVQLNYRLTFASLLSNWLADVSMDSGIVNDLTETGVKQRLLVNELALRYKNQAVSRKYSSQARKILSAVDQEDEIYQNLGYQEKMATYRYAYLFYENEIDVIKRFKYIMGSWYGAMSLYKNKNIDVSLKVKTCHLIFDVTQTFRSWILANDAIVWQAIEDDFVRQELETKNPKELEYNLFNYSFNKLKEICREGNAKEMAESYTKFAEYCQKLTVDVYDRKNLKQTEFLYALLKAMSFGSVKAVRYFPCLLKHSIYRDSELLSELFVKLCRAIPTRMFLDWQEEIISHLVTPLAAQVLPIVKKLCIDYPSAIILALRRLLTNSTADDLYKSIFANYKYDTFFCAMEYLCQPEEYLRRRLLEFIRSIDNNESLSEAIKSLMSKIATNTTLQSAAFKKLLTNNRKEYEKLASITDVVVAKKTAEQLYSALGTTMSQRIEKNELTESTKLSYYSPFLNDFAERDFDVDVPIQFDALQQRPKIVRIDRFVQVVSSKSKSLVIKIVGSDGKTYEFLVKCDIDLRQSQKMQRIFKTVNETLKDDLNCFKRHLSVSTYSIVPISTSIGLIQWIPNVKSLEDIVEFSLTDKAIIQNVKEKYREWIDSASEEEASNQSLIYKRALVKYSADNVSEKMIELSADIKPNLIQRTCLQISSSLDSYFKLRQNFIKNYATMCLTDWLFGVGDRRLKNILMDIYNSNCFGINFDLIFGAATELPIPELVPFRLTAQITNFMKPFKEQDLFGATMCHVLKALKNDSHLIIGCLEAFLREPVKWNAKVNLLWKKDDETHDGVEWTPSKKIEIIKQKLRGVKPSKTMTDELSFVHKQPGDRYFSLFQLIVNGNEMFHTTARSLMKDHELTPEEQVLCLLDQATDVNTIGRMWADWKCFV